MREILIDTVAHVPPPKGLEALTPDDADRRVAGANHTIAEIVAHMAYWQEWFIMRCNGTGSPPPARAADGWPAVEPGTWPSIEKRFVSGLERAVSLENRLDDAIAPPIEFPPLAHYTVRDALVHMAQHNSHHLGQVILLRQMIGAWPPPSGGWTW